MDRETRENHLDLPQLPAGRDAHKGAMIKMVASLVLDGVVERTTEEAMTSFIATSISPTSFFTYEYCIA